MTIKIVYIPSKHKCKFHYNDELLIVKGNSSIHTHKDKHLRYFDSKKQHHINRAMIRRSFLSRIHINMLLTKTSNRQ
jgi:hypothetical protein